MHTCVYKIMRFNTERSREPNTFIDRSTHATRKRSVCALASAVRGHPGPGTLSHKRQAIGSALHPQRDRPGLTRPWEAPEPADLHPAFLRGAPRSGQRSYTECSDPSLRPARAHEAINAVSWQAGQVRAERHTLLHRSRRVEGTCANQRAESAVRPLCHAAFSCETGLPGRAKEST